jgi:hypothetical protein
MKTLFQSTVAILFILVMSMPVQARDGSTTGNRLAGFCNSESLDLSALCAGLIIGFIDGSSLSAKYCIPKDVTNEQIRKVVRKYLDEHPEELHVWYGLLVSLAIGKAFPCNSQEEK